MTTRIACGGRRFLLAALVLFLATRVAAADWPHWRGPARNGSTTESSGWAGSWPGPLLWTAEVGEGASAPLVVAGRVYALGWSEERERLTALDAATGGPLWAVSYAAPAHGRHSTGDKGLYSGPNGTPEFDPQTGYLYTLGTDGALRCWDTAKEGEPVWGLDLYEVYGAAQRPKIGRSGRRDYGYTTSPLVHGDWLIVEAGAPSGNLVAFDKRTGREAWRSANTDPAGHTGGLVPLEFDGVPGLAVLTLQHLLVVRLDGERAGETVVEHPWSTAFANNIPTPAAAGNLVVITSGYNHQAIRALRIGLDGASVVWERDLFSKVCSPLIGEGYVCWAWMQLHCLDLATGATLWEGGSFGDAGSLIRTADERLIVWSDPGQLALVESPMRSRDRYVELARQAKLAESDAWPHVAFDDGRLYVRDRSGKLQCFTAAGAPRSPAEGDAGPQPPEGDSGAER